MERIYMGIDNGLDGAIVVNINGVIENRWIMPTLKLGKGRKVDVLAIRDIISSWAFDNLAVLIERPAGSQSVKPAVSMAQSFCTIETYMILNSVKYLDITAMSWQKTYWTRPKMAKGDKFDTKAAALVAANKIWPSTDWRKNDRCRVPHDGIVDAALIAEYGRRKNL